MKGLKCQIPLQYDVQTSYELLLHEKDTTLFNSSQGVMNAADYYGLDELKSSCLGFIQVIQLSLHAN